MKLLPRLVSPSSILLAGGLLFHCSASNREIEGDDAGTPTSDGSVIFTGGDSGAETSAPKTETVVYAHTETTIYKIDPSKPTLSLEKIGDVECMGVGASGDPSLTDLAVDKNGQIFGVSSNYAYTLSIQGTTIKCDKKWQLTGANSGTKDHPVFFGLTIAPEGTISATEETLVAANSEGDLFQIDKTNGNTTLVGTFGNDKGGKPWGLSGDIVFLANNGSPIGFATVRTDTSTVDSLIEINVGAIKPGSQSVQKSIRGTLKRGGWCSNSKSPQSFDKMFGIAAFNDKVYGFSDAGEIVEIRNNDGTACLIQSNGNMRFKGAGVTTSAPVIPPSLLQ